jgi:hypothetical protein
LDEGGWREAGAKALSLAGLFSGLKATVPSQQQEQEQQQIQKQVLRCAQDDNFLGVVLRCVQEMIFWGWVLRCLQEDNFLG